jgi:hypothetical protein
MQPRKASNQGTTSTGGNSNVEPIAAEDSLALTIPKESFHSADYGGTKELGYLVTVAHALTGCEAFLLECQRRSIPLAKVKSDLSRYADMLNAQLVALINKDYAEFVELSSSVLGADAVIQSLRESLLKLRGELRVVRDTVDARVLGNPLRALRACDLVSFLAKWLFLLFLTATPHLAMQSIQDKIRAAEQDKRLLQTFVDVSESLEDVECLFGLNVGGEMDTEALRDPVKISRFVAGWSEVALYSSKHSDAAFIRKLQPRIARVERALESAMQTLFLEAIAAPNPKLHECMRVFGALNRPMLPQELFRVHVLGPAISDIVTVKALEAGRRTSCDGLPEIYRALVHFVMDKVVPVGDPGLVQAAFDEIVELFMSRFGTVLFATGIPETFHRNYTTSLKFVQQWQDTVLQREPSTVALFAASESLRKWNRGWKLEVYFTLRMQEIVRSVESALANADCNVKPDPFVLSAVSACHQILCRLWDDQFFLPGLEAQSARLTLQIVTRIRSWCLSFPTTDALRLAAAHHDLLHLAKRLLSLYADLALKAVPPSSAAQRAMLKAYSLLATNIDQSTLPQFSSQIVGLLSAECVAALQFVRKINSVCFRPDSLVPTVPMSDVENVVGPLRRLISNCGWLDDSVRVAWCQGKPLATVHRRTRTDRAVSFASTVCRSITQLQGVGLGSVTAR